MRASTIVILIVGFVGTFAGVVGVGIYRRANEQAKQEISPADQIKPSLAVAMDKHQLPVAVAKPATSQPTVQIVKVNADLAKPEPVVKVVEKPVEKPKPRDPERVIQAVSVVAPNPPPVQKMAAGAKDLVLLAGDAALHGQNLRKLPGGEIAGLSGKSDFLEWTVEPAQAGVYSLEITYATPEKAGGVFHVAAGAHLFTETAKPTGGWDQYATRSLGRATLPAKPTKIVLKPSIVRDAGLMNVKNITITFVQKR
jgi:hypothetical protein